MNKITTRLFYLLKNNSDLAHICLITILWIFMITIVNPIGDFPLNDDWAYGWTVKKLLETGQFELSDWTAANLLPQALWGTLFCLPFGFSFTALRLSTLTLGLGGLFATYGLFREANANPQISLLSSLVVALNPIYFELSNSFNTDIPSLTFFIISIYFLARGVRLNSRFYTFIGLTFSFISILNRQSSLIILPAFGIAYLIRKGFAFKNIIKALFPVFLGVLVYSSYSNWLNSTKQTPLLYGFQIEKLTETFSSGLKTIFLIYAENTFLFSIYLGLFTFPLLLLQFPLRARYFSKQQRLVGLCFTLFLLAIGVSRLLKGEQMPLMGNIIEFLGLGPQVLEGYNFFLGQDRFLRILIRGCWIILMFLGLLGSSILLQFLIFSIQNHINRKNQLSQGWLIVFLLACIFIYLLSIGGLGKKYWFDRYLILPLPLLIAIVLILTQQFPKHKPLKLETFIPFFMILLFLGSFTISATHDYLSWHRVRWIALNSLMQEFKVLPNQIGGGFEFDGWYFANQIETCNPEFRKNHQNTSAKWEDFWCFDDSKREYKVSFVSKAGYKQQSSFSFRRWLPWREQVLYVLRKNE